MKRFYIRIISLLLVAALFPISDVLPNCMDFFISAEAANHYMINGKAVSFDMDICSDTCNNSEYIGAIYQHVWGVNFTNDFTSSDNIIKNLPYEMRELNKENLKTFVMRAQPGTALKVETISQDSVDSDNGYCVFIVSFDTNGFTVFEKPNEKKESYYTWEQFCSIYAYSTIRFLKWPNSFFSKTESANEKDYKKPDRTLYYDADFPLCGNDVKWVQQKLVDAGYSIGVDGYYGRTTEEAIKEFQSDFLLPCTGIADDETLSLLEDPVKKPEPIELSLTNKSDKDLSIGDVLTVCWKKVDYADNYHIMVYNSRGNLVDELDNVTANKASFVLKNAGTYTVKGLAQNRKYTGEISTLSQKIKVHNTYTVKFFDDEGTLLSKQTVAYGQDAAVPAAPRKTGHSFSGWDTEFSNVTAPISVTAKFNKKLNTVVFVDASGNEISNQKVLYGEAAISPDTSTIDGFIGWNKDFSYVEKSMTITAVVSNEETLPTTVFETSAVREAESSGYTVKFKVRNNTESKVIGRAVVALKTTSGKFLTLTESSAFVLYASDINASSYTQKNLSVFVPYSGAATVVEIYIVENYNDLVPMSKVNIITDIVTTNNYTDWLTDDQAPETYYSATNYRTEYRYKTKSTTTSSASSKAGWTKYDTRITSYNYSSWSDWTSSPINSTDLREVQTKTETYTTGYNMRYWATQASSSPHYRHYWNYERSAERKSYGVHNNYKWVSLGEYNSYATIYPGGISSGTYSGYNKGTEAGKNINGYIFFPYETTKGSTTYYRYQDKTPVYTYYYYRWSDWSGWSTNVAVASDSKQVETRLTRQYEVNDPTECNTGKSRVISGVLDKSLAGKQAMLFVFKVGDASDFTNEFVGQAQIDENGAYSFSFKLREEPSIETGDFYVTLGIEGANTVFNLDTIKAPLPQYTVNIYDGEGDDANLIDSQIVTRGESAILPKENPSKPGYKFAGWNYSNTGIYEDTDITALYVQEEYTVVFIDWTNERFDIQIGYHYEDPLIAPDFNMGFVSDANQENLDSLAVWNGAPENMLVTENMVITAEYTEREYIVKFYDYDKNVISTQTIKYGESATSPQLNSDESKMFISWDSYDFGFVTADLDIKPIFCYTQTAENPVASVDSGIYSKEQVVKLSSTTPNATIFYSINGGEEKLYEKPLTISETSEIEFYASSLGYNNSAKAKVYYIINKSGEPQNWKYPVTVYDGEKIVATYIVDACTSLEDVLEPYAKSGHHFEGYFKDATFRNEWNISEDTVNTALFLYVKTVPEEYNVTFIYEDGTIIESQTVKYLDSAEPPEKLQLADNECFVKWDTDDYSCVTGNLTVVAIIRDKSEVANITLNKTELTTITGMSFKLVATITPDEFAEKTIVWKSSDNNIVSVDSNGEIKAVSTGEATIYAVLAEDSAFFATCVVKVQANKAENICLIKSSDYSIVSGKLCGVLPQTNTVEHIFSQIDSDELVAYSTEGDELGATDLMETGSTICLMDKHGVVIDVVTVVVAGDVNSDGSVNNKDTTMLFRFFANKEFIEEDNLLASDTNADGRVSLHDVAVLQQYVKGMDCALTA